MRKTWLLTAGFVCLLALGGPAQSGSEGDMRAQGAQHKAAISRLEAERGPFAASLVAPLMALADWQMSTGNLPEATESLRRAQNIIHRSQGVHSPAQLEAVAQLTKVAMALHDWRAANQQQEFAFFTLTRHHGPAAPETFTAYLDLANWYLRTGQPMRAGRLLVEARDAASARDQRFAIAMLEERARRLQGACCNARRLAEALAESEGQAGDADALAALHLTLADSLLLGRQPEESWAHYARAAAASPAAGSAPPYPISAKRVLEAPRTEVMTLRPRPSFMGTRLERVSPREQLRDPQQPPRWFILDGDQTHLGFTAQDLRDTAPADPASRLLVGRPLMFNRAQLDQLLPPSLKSPEALAGLAVELSFTVTREGRLEDIEVVESNAPKRVERLLVTALRRASYRPRLVDGEPSRTEDVRLAQRFAPQEIRL